MKCEDLPALSIAKLKLPTLGFLSRRAQNYRFDTVLIRYISYEASFISVPIQWKKLVLNLSTCFEILKLIHPITLYRLYELTRKQIIPLLGTVVQGWFILQVMALHSFLLFILIFLSVAWGPGIGDNNGEEKG